MNGIETTVELFLIQIILPTKLDISYVSVCCRKNISQELQIFCESKKQKFEEGKNV